MIDVLSSLVGLLRLRGDIYGRLELGAPFGLRFPSDVGHFFLVLSGSARLLVAAADHALAPGDFVFIPSSESFALSSVAPDAPVLRDFSENEGRAYMGEGLIRTQGDLKSGCALLSGCFNFAPHEADILIDQMAGPIIKGFKTEGSETGMGAVFDIVAREMASARPGSFAIIDRMLETMLIETLRTGLDNDASSWLSALRDPRIGRALSKMHFEPQTDWTVAGLAEVAGMSRSSFATRFRSLTGRTPMEHLARWRMQRAAHLLTDGQHRSVGEVTARVGYTSEAAFRRQFIAIFGMSPKMYRAKGRQRAGP